MTAQERRTLPSADTLHRRVEKARRQADFAKGAGWTAVAQAYERLAVALEALAKRAAR